MNDFWSDFRKTAASSRKYFNIKIKIHQSFSKQQILGVQPKNSGDLTRTCS